MEEIIKDLKVLLKKVESWDNSGMPELDRERLGKIHDIIEDCIDDIETI